MPGSLLLFTPFSALLHEGAEVVALCVLVLVALLVRISATDRIRALTQAGLIVVALILALFIPVLESRSDSAPVYLRRFCIFLEGVALIGLTIMALFQALLPALRIRAPRILQDVLVASAHLVWGLICLNASGVNLTGIVATSAVLTAVIGFSMQDTLGNLLAGVALQIDQSLHVGDWIKLGELEGRVTETRWRYTAIETRDWETVVIPNSVLMKGQFLVLGRRQGQPTKWRRWVYFNVDFRTTPAKVIQAVETALRAAEFSVIAKDPPIHCVHADIADSYSRYAVRYFLTDPAQDATIDSEVRSHIIYALRRAGIPPAMPSRAVFLTQNSAALKKARRRGALLRRVKALQLAELFRMLSPAELRHLAARVVVMPYKPGEAITRQGSKADGLYLVTKGAADVVITNEAGLTSKVKELEVGSVFGEHAMLTGEPRSASVIARTEVECFCIDKEAFKDILFSRQKVADEISAILAKRKVEREQVLQQLDEKSNQARELDERRDILSKIRALFGLQEPR